MIITPQLVFMVLGIVALVVAAVLLVMAIAYYVRNDIRGVQDDLSGKTRQGQATSATNRSRRRRDTYHPAQVDTPSFAAVDPDDEQVRNVAGGVVQPAEDDLDTVLDTKLRKIANAGAVSSDTYDVNDDIPTLVTSAGDYHNSSVPERNVNDEDAPTMVEGEEGELPTEVEAAAADGRPSFVVTRSILAIHANEVITVG